MQGMSRLLVREGRDDNRLRSMRLSYDQTMQPGKLPALASMKDDGDADILLPRARGVAREGLAQSERVFMKYEAPTTPDLRPGTLVCHGTREGTVVAVDSDPEAHVWIVYVDDPDADAMVHREQLTQPCALCEREPATVDALDDNTPVRLCKGCFEYDNGTAES